jgi:ankyrin repeat protein
MIRAILTHDEDAALRLVDDVDVNEKDGDGMLPLHHAAERRMPRLVTELLKKAPWTVNEQNKDGWTPLHLAAIEGEVMIAATLLQSHALVNEKTAQRETPISLAVQHGSVDMARLLVSHGAKFDLQNLNLEDPGDIELFLLSVHQERVHRDRMVLVTLACAAARAQFTNPDLVRMLRSFFI